MRHGSLFSGIGGFDLASEWMGWENVFHCEWNEFGQKVLKHYWPKAITYNDITKTDFSIHRGTIDIITGGFPCQPYSMAGKRLGKEDERHLWPEMLRCIREVQPTWVVGENVLGLVNWNGGLVFHEVQADLEAQGYEVQPYVLPAASVNAPHRRDRVWFVAFNSKSERDSKVGGIWQGKDNESIGVRNSTIERSFINSDHKGRSTGFGQIQSKDGEVHKWNNNAEPSHTGIQSDATYSDCNRSTQYGKDSESKGQSEYLEKQKEWIKHSEQYNELFGFSSDASDSELKGLQGQRREWNRCSEHRSDKRILIRSENKLISSDSNGIGLRGQSNRIRESRFFDKEGQIRNWDNFPTVSPICSRDDGISDRLDSITFPKWRNESIKAGGNAIVPQVVYQIFKAIEQYETTRHTQGT